MKKFLATLTTAAMLAALPMTAFAEDPFEELEKTDVLARFLKETDLEKKDIALQLQQGENQAELVLGGAKDAFHMIARENGTELSHVLVTPTAMYIGSEGKVTMLQYATVTTLLQDLIKEIDARITQAVNSIPENQLPTEAEIRDAANKAAVLESLAASQAQADAATLLSAASAFAGKLKPEYILDVKETDESVEVSLRSDAYASALGEAMDSLMSNRALAELVDRKAAANGGQTFAAFQQNWLVNREAALEAIRTVESTEKIEENGHLTSHFQIGDETADEKILVCDTDAWIDVDYDTAEMTITLGFKDEDPLLVYESAVDPDQFREKLTADNSRAEINLEYEDGFVNSGKINLVVEDQQELQADFGPDYLYMKGPKGGISTSVRETWTGKIRHELVAETAEGQSASLIVDYYEDDDSLVCEMKVNDSDQPLVFRVSRIDKVAAEDLSAAANIEEITTDAVMPELIRILDVVLPAQPAAPEAPAEEAAAEATAEEAVAEAPAEEAAEEAGEAAEKAAEEADEVVEEAAAEPAK